MWILHWYLVALMEYIFMWIFKIGKFEYIDIWQVLKKKKKVSCWKYMYVDLYMLKIWLLAGCRSIYVENITVGRMQGLYWKCDYWNSCWIWKKKKKKRRLERNDKERLKKNILIKWYWKFDHWNSCWIWKKKWLLERNNKERLKNNILIKW